MLSFCSFHFFFASNPSFTHKCCPHSPSNLCTSELDCPNNLAKVDCPYDPCHVASCSLYPDAVCGHNVCGECSPQFTLDGVVVDCNGGEYFSVCRFYLCDLSETAFNLGCHDSLIIVIIMILAFPLYNTGHP